MFLPTDSDKMLSLFFLGLPTCQGLCAGKHVYDGTWNKRTGPFVLFHGFLDVLGFLNYLRAGRVMLHFEVEARLPEKNGTRTLTPRYVCAGPHSDRRAVFQRGLSKVEWVQMTASATLF